MIIAVPKETTSGERRVALTPAMTGVLAKTGFQILVESNAGASAGFRDAQYTTAGAKIVDTQAEAFAADCVVMVRADANELPAALLRDGQTIIGLCDPLSQPQAAQHFAQRGVTLFSLEMIPRITRAQSMDVLSSMATVAGYRAVLLAAVTLPKMFPLLTTAAGTLTPAKVFVVGAGVAGLQAIATARRLGAVVSAYDVRAAAKEQVMSLGAKFIEMPLDAGNAEGQGGYARQMDEEFYRKQRELMKRVVAEHDVVITTASVPGKKAPTLITSDMVEAMPPGSVIVDLAAERGGNCELTKPGETVEVHGVTILGPTNLPAEIPQHASQMFAKNIATFLQHLVKDGALHINLQDEITRETLITRGGDVVHPKVRELLGLPPTPPDGTTIRLD